MAAWQQAIRNSADAWTAASTSARAMRLKPNWGKNSGAVAVRRNICVTPCCCDASRALAVSHRGNRKRPEQGTGAVGFQPDDTHQRAAIVGHQEIREMLHDALVR
jgi:hypothetical protein